MRDSSYLPHSINLCDEAISTVCPGNINLFVKSQNITLDIATQGNPAWEKTLPKAKHSRGRLTLRVMQTHFPCLNIPGVENNSLEINALTYLVGFLMPHGANKRNDTNSHIPYKPPPPPTSQKKRRSMTFKSSTV